MAIETKADDVSPERGPLHRWSCLVCLKRGVWVRDPDQAREGMRKHLTSRQHLERARQLAEHRGGTS